MQARTETAIQADIDHIRDLLNSGVKSTVIDGHSVTFDPDSARKQLRSLENELTDVTGTKRKRPRVLQIQLTR